MSIRLIYIYFWDTTHNRAIELNVSRNVNKSLRFSPNLRLSCGMM